MTYLHAVVCIVVVAIGVWPPGVEGDPVQFPSWFCLAQGETVSVLRDT